MTVDRAFAVHGSVERAKRKKEEKEVHRKRIAVCAPRGKRKRRKKEDESTTVGDRVRRVQTSRERKPAWREKDEQNHLRCTCCAGGSFGPVLKVYQAFLLLLFLLLLLLLFLLLFFPPTILFFQRSRFHDLRVLPLAILRSTSTLAHSCPSHSDDSTLAIITLPPVEPTISFR